MDEPLFRDPKVARYVQRRQWHPTHPSGASMTESK